MRPRPLPASALVGNAPDRRVIALRREMFRISTAGVPMAPAWLIADPEPFDEYDLGPLKTGKEAEVFLVERIAPDGRRCLLAHKRYRPRRVMHKGELQELGFQRAADFVNDRAYRDGRTIANSRDRRAACLWNTSATGTRSHHGSCTRGSSAPRSTTRPDNSGRTCSAWWSPASS